MNDEQRKVLEIIKDTRLAMLTQIDSSGKLVSRPMATQDSDFDGTIYFIAERDTEKVRDLATNPQVNLAYSGKGAWASVSGTARVVDDEAKLKQLWSSFTSSWLEGGPENPNNILIEVTADSAEYWDAPGNSTVIQLVNLAKSAVTGKRVEGDNETTDFRSTDGSR